MPLLASDTVLTLARNIVDESKSYAARHPQYHVPLLWKWHDSIYLGSAHGIVGILSTLLSVASLERQALDREMNFTSLVRICIQRLDSFCWPSGNLDSSISARHSVDRLVQWCHGAPGHVMLLIKAARVLGDSAWLQTLNGPRKYVHGSFGNGGFSEKVWACVTASLETHMP